MGPGDANVSEDRFATVMEGARGDAAEEWGVRAGKGGEVHVMNAGGRGKDRGELGHGVVDSGTDDLEDMGGEGGVQYLEVNELVVGMRGGWDCA